ncbi:hypothetical protein [Sphingomonas sp. DC1100-1]|uniref:hypothetical protein n=1 Tax=unclassified Sphingomonas TaxID=196159 RepID=UPI003CE8B88A
MLDWRGLVGTSAANGCLALMLAGLMVPLRGTCADCGGAWAFSDYVSHFLGIPSHAAILPVQTAMQPIVVVALPYRTDNRSPCPDQPPVDRLPTIIGSQAVALPAVTACVRVDADGRVQRIRTIGGNPAGTDPTLRRLTFIPAMRGGKIVASWVEIQGNR